MDLVKMCIFIFYIIIQSLNCDDTCPYRHIVVVDGGSSGTRVHVFKFDRANQVKLIKSENKKIKNALSEFSESKGNLDILDNVVKTMITSASKIVPSQCSKDTPFYVQVTAGVRQLEPTISNRILTKIRVILLKSEYRFNPEFVQILSTSEEGMYAWISINFLMGKLQQTDSDPLETYGVLDLGGGSTQIAFATKNFELYSKVIKLKVLGRLYYIYADGYDYMGMDETRMKYFSAQHCFKTECKNRIFSCQCLNPESNGRYFVRQRNIMIRGKEICETNRFDFCYGRALKFIEPIKPIREYFNKMNFIAISSLYHILKGAKTLNKTKYGLYETNIGTIIDKAITICLNPPKYKNPNEYKHFLCMDISYVLALLQNGYEFQYYDKLKTTSKINNISLSWSLGYAVSVLS